MSLTSLRSILPGALGVLLGLGVAGGLLVWPAPAAAEGAWVLVDNSGSMGRLARTYHLDLRDFIELGEPDLLIYSTIASVPPGGRWRIRSDDADAGKAVIQTFTFSGSTTPIAESLARAAGDDAFARVDHVVIVTDMDPDHQAVGKRFDLSREDVDDLDRTLRRLDAWLADGIEIDLILQGWERTPSVSRYSRAKLDALPKDLAQAVAQGKRIYNGQPLVDRALAWLSDKHGGKLRLAVIEPRNPDGSLNEEGFRERLCGALRPHLAAHANLCDGAAGGGGRIISLGTRIDISNQMMRTSLIPRVRSRWPDNVYAGGMPRRLLDPVVNIGVGTGHDPNVVLHFKVLPGFKGTEPFHYPELRATGRLKDGTIITLTAPPPNQVLGDREQMLDWAVETATAMIEDFVREYYPLEQRLKKIWITLPNGEPVPDGLHFQAIYDTGASKPGESMVASTRGGALQIRLPISFKDCALFLTKPDGDLVDSAFSVGVDDVRKRRGIERTLNADFESDYSIYYCVADPADPTNCGAELDNPVDLRLFLEAGDGELREWPVGEGNLPGAAVRLRRDGPLVTLKGLFPGEYQVESRVRERPPRHLARLDLKIDPANKRDDIEPISPDRLADGWDAGLFDYRETGGNYILSVDSRTHLRASAWYLLRLLEHSSDVLGQSGGPDKAELDRLVGLWRAIRSEIWGDDNHAGATELYGRWLAPAMAPLGLTGTDGEPVSGAMSLVQAMFNRFIDNYDARLDRQEQGLADLRQRYRTMLGNLRSGGQINTALYQRLRGQ
jgi:hypothetical protein